MLNEQFIFNVQNKKKKKNVTFLSKIFIYKTDKYHVHENL